MKTVKEQDRSDSKIAVTVELLTNHGEFGLTTLSLDFDSNNSFVMALTRPYNTNEFNGTCKGVK